MTAPPDKMFWWLNDFPAQQNVLEPRWLTTRHNAQINILNFQQSQTMDILEKLSSFEPQNHLTTLDTVLERLNIITIKAKATKILQPALIAQLSDFKGFDRSTLTRFEHFLQCVFGTINPIPEYKAKALKELNVIPLIICGLCLNKKALDRTDKDVFQAVIRLARDAPPKLGAILIADKDVHGILGKGPSPKHTDGESDTLLLVIRCLTQTELETILQLHLQNESMLGSLAVSGHRSWCYRGVPKTHMFPRLTALAVGCWVTTFVPVSSVYDAVLEITAVFDSPCLTLFGLDRQAYEAGMIVLILILSSANSSADDIQQYPAQEEQIAIVLGEDVFQAIQASQKWQEGAPSGLTPCVIGYTFPGHVIVVRITVGYVEGVEYANMAYGS